MARVLITQRVDVSQPYGERRDALDQRWYGFLNAVGVEAIALPNDEVMARTLLAGQTFQGVILSGGNDLASLGGDAPERDRVEQMVLDMACAQKFPVIGVCRGMQLIAEYFASTLGKVTNHAGTRHSILFENGISREVNSYHHYAVTHMGDSLHVTAHAPDGVVEAFQHEHDSILAMMWHPEREAVADVADITLFQQHLGVT